MTDNITGIEHDTVKSCQPVHSFGSSLLEESESVVMHPISSLERAGEATYHGAERLGSATVGAVVRGVERAGSAVKHGFTNLYDRVTGHQAQEHGIVLNEGPSNLDKVNQVSELVQPVAPTVTLRTHSRNFARRVVNWIILLLVLLLIGVIIYLTCKRYTLVGDALSTGDRMMAAALLSPELSSGLTTLAAAL
jgi:hypothetical protein